jgi:hypothetical protein
MLTRFFVRSQWILALCACHGFYQMPVPGWETALRRVVPMQCGLIVCHPGDLKTGCVVGSLGKNHERMVASFTVQKIGLQPQRRNGRTRLDGRHNLSGFLYSSMHE